MERASELPMTPSAVDEQKRYLIRLVTVDRKSEKTFSTPPVVSEAIRKANRCGCDGGKLLLANDGCEICDNEAFLHYITRGAKFVVANDALAWNTSLNDINDSSEAITSSIRSDTVGIREQYNSKINSTAITTQDSDWQKSSIEAMPSTFAVIVNPEKLYIDTEVPWHIIPEHIREKLFLGEPLGIERNELCEVLVRHLRVISSNVPLRVMRVIAYRVIMQYPKSFQKEYQKNLLTLIFNFSLRMQHYNKLIEQEENEQRQIDRTRRENYIDLHWSSSEDLSEEQYVMTR